jgi:DNA-binding NarL/FixJ family response regulator
VPVVVITAHDEPGTAERVLTLGASVYLKKPVDRDILFAAIAKATSGTEAA